MTTANGAFASERAEYLSILGVSGADPTTIPTTQLKIWASLNSEERQGNPQLFDGGGNLRTDAAVEFLSQALVVGNAATATTSVGALANKIQVYDVNGNSLGFVPVYATIT